MPAKAANRTGRRAPLNLRTTDELREKLEAAAAAAGRPLTHEVEYRLERTFKELDLGDGAISDFVTVLVGSLRLVESRSGRKFGTDQADYDKVAEVVSYVVNNFKDKRASETMGTTKADEPSRPAGPTYLRPLIEETVELTVQRLGLVPVPSPEEEQEYQSHLADWRTHLKEQGLENNPLLKGKEPTFAAWRAMKARHKAEEYSEPPDPPRAAPPASPAEQAGWEPLMAATPNSPDEPGQDSKKGRRAKPRAE